MKTSIRMAFGCALTAMILAFLPACEQEPAPTPAPKVTAAPATPVPPPADTGLVPDHTSTGNPPLIPHQVDPSDGGEECLGCHEDGEDAPKIPDWHATLRDCRQCHVTSDQTVNEFKTQY